MAGMSGAEVDVRYPKLDPGQQYHVQIEDAHYFNGRNIGLAIFVDVKVLESSEEGSIGQMRSIKIDGFSNENARNFAFSDAKMLLIAAWHYQGLTKDWKGDGQPQPWERFLDQNVTNKDPEKDQQEFPTLVGKRLYIQTSEIETKFVEPKTGQKARKLKHLFAPARETL
jgi:hypothetical protein